MSTKPTIALARFADTGSADVTAPSSGLRDTGFVAGTPVSQSFVNELFKQLYLWALYLNDGALSGNHTITGTLEVTSALTVDAAAVVAGAITIGGQSLNFTDFTYTGDSTTDQLTRTAHGLETGDGPVRTSNSGGALPAGLAAATDYYVVKVDADHFRLAMTRTNAITGVVVDITSNGTGTQTLLRQAGTTRASDATITRNLALSGNAEIGGSLTVGGAVTSPRLQGGAMRLSPLGTNGTVFVEQVAPSGLSASYTLTWPAALPAATQYLAVDPSGNITAGKSNVPLTIPGGAFVQLPRSGSSGATRSGLVWSISAAINVELTADITGILIPGTKITSLVWSIFGSPGASGSAGIELRMRKRSFGDRGTTASDVVSDVFTMTIPSSASTRTSLTATTPYLVEPSMMYQLSVFVNGGSVTFDGAMMTIDRL